MQRIVLALAVMVAFTSCSTTVSEPAMGRKVPFEELMTSPGGLHGNVYDKPTFARSSSEITPATDALLVRAATMIRKYRIQVRLVGQASNCDSEDRNVQLSVDRANRVRERLLSLGVPSQMILSTTGVGSSLMPPNVAKCQGNGFDIVDINVQTQTQR